MLTSSSEHILSVRDLQASSSRSTEKSRAHIQFQQLADFISHHPSTAGNDTSDTSTYSSIGAGDSPAILNNGKSRGEALVCADLENSDQSVAVWQHTWELRYTHPNGALDRNRGYVDGNVIGGNYYGDEEKRFIEFLYAEDEGRDDTKVYDFDDVYFTEGSDSFWLCRPFQKDTVPIRLVRLPHLEERSCEEDLDYRYTTNNLLQLADILVWESRISVKMSMQLSVLPKSQAPLDDGALPFSLAVKMVLYLKLPNVFEASFKSLKAEEAQRRLLAHIFGESRSTSTGLYREMDVPQFLSILRPAPNFTSKLADDAAQPSRLLPTLLPFQRRSVGWLLEREGKTINEKGEVEDLDTSKSSVTLFWTQITISEEITWYYNRLYGLLSPDMPQSEISGGILAEEPGMGKTLECIALILLNPAKNRIAANTRWDPLTRLEVKETKVCNINI